MSYMRQYNMFTFKMILTILVLGIACNNCGGKGHIVSVDESLYDYPPSPPIPPVIGMQRTKVDFDTLPYNLASDNDPACKNVAVNHSLVDLGVKFQNIEDLKHLPVLESWPNESLLVSDISGDNDGNFDFNKVGIGKFKDDLIIVWNGDLNQGVTYVWDLGFFSSRQNSIHRVSKTYIRIAQGIVTLISGGESLTIDEKDWDFEIIKDRSLLRISMKYFDNITAYPHWFVRGFALKGKAILDSTSVGIFYSLLNPDYRLFELTTCWLNVDSPYEMPIVVLRDIGSISEEAESRMFEKVFLKSLRKFILTHFSSNEFIPKLKSFSRIFFITGKEIHPINYENSDIFPMNIDRKNDSIAYHGVIINMEALKAKNSPFPEHSAELAFNRAIGYSFLAQENEAHGEQFMKNFYLLTLMKAGTKSYGKRFLVDTLASIIGNLNVNTLDQVFDEKNDDNLVRLMCLLEPHLKLVDIWRIWRIFNKTLYDEESSDERLSFFKTLIFYFKGESSIAVKNLDFTGWIEKGEYHPLLNPKKVIDSDIDGLPDYLEELIGSNLYDVDTDQDSWSDTSEWILDKSTINPLDHPTQIIADGVFGDWQKLLPRKIITDKNRSGMCNNQGDIDFFGGLAQKSAIVIGAVSTQMTENTDIQWEIDLDIPANNKRLIFVRRPQSFYANLELLEKPDGESVLKKKRIFNIILGMNRIQRTMEITFDAKDFGESVQLNQIEGIRLRLRTSSSNSGQICDETEWFSPVLSEGAGDQTNFAP
jgi:hypothetical protein